mmetsp:Transcript_105828/g.309553  ORF Transcript_105828/g.309553 Transcript_105828/m.309553 type:complete len:101 (+) Transcript_105828:148-450(+)
MDKQHIRVIDRISPGSLAEQWNRLHPDCAVSPGDRLVQVNGQSGGLEVLSRELSRKGQVACEFQSARPKKATALAPVSAAARGVADSGGGHEAQRRQPGP